MKKAWGGRFSGGESELMEIFNESISFDNRLYKVDIEGSIAFSKALVEAGILTEEERETIIKAFKQIEAEIENGEFIFDIKDEDIHMAIEKRLTQITGDVGAKIHTGRSRNDQVSTDVRLYLKKEIISVKLLLVNLLKVINKKAKANIDVVLPGYTHLQQAQVILYPQYINALFFELKRDYDRFCDLEKRVDIMPLGSGAIAGNTFGLNRETLQKELNFGAMSDNSIDAISDRDFIAEFIFVCSLVAMHTSRFAEDGIIYSTQEFGFYRLDDMFSTGSSMMPQKKNPDSLELIRGKTGRFFGNLMQILTIQKGISYSYNKDLQEDKEALFDSIDNIKLVLEVLAGVIETLQINKDNMENSIDDFIYATDIADYLVKKGMPFRKSHHVVGNLVGYCEKQSIKLQEISLERYKEESELFENDVYTLFDPINSVNLRTSYGGTAKSSVEAQLKKAEEFLAGL